MMTQKMTVWVFCVGFFFASGNAWSKQEPEWKVTPTGSVTNYFLYNSRPFFTTPQRTWTETAVVGGAVFNYKDQLTAKGTFLGVKTSGEDPFGNAGAVNTSPAFDLDQAFVKYRPIENNSLSISLGRQTIQIGDQFIVGDAIYDGFGGATQGVYSAPRKGYDAARVEWDLTKIHFDTFFLFVDPTYDAGGGRDATFFGIDISRSFEKIKGNYGLGLFYRSDSLNDDNDMGVFSFRFDQQVSPVAGELTLSGEIVYEHGDCNSAFYCTTAGAQNLREYAWHGEVGYKATQFKKNPFVEVGYAYFSDDYHPVFSGYSTWGRWYMGNQISWINFNTNQKVIRAQIGFSPHKTVTTRLMYFNTQLVTGVGGTLSNAYNLTTDWTPNDWFWVGSLVGYADARGAVTANALANPFTGTAAGTSDSIDIIVMTGVWF